MTERLRLRDTWPGKIDDYSVELDGVAIGRIFLQRHLPGAPWTWSITLPLGRTDVTGRADSLEKAKAAWKAKWAEVLPSVADYRLADLLQRQRETKARNDAWAKAHGFRIKP